jgi:peptide/nickel transport system permease protein
MSVVTIYILATLLFVLLHAMPGDIVNAMIKPGMSAEQVENIKQKFGLNEPLWKQYVDFITSYLFFEFGVSFKTFEPVSEQIKERIVPTLILFFPAFVLQYAIGIVTGTYFGWKRGTKTDLVGFISGLTLYSTPFFWFGWILLGVFAYSLGLFPGGSMLTPFVTDFTWAEGTLDLLWHLVIPVFSLALIGWAGPMLVMRTSMQDVVNSDYIGFAKAQGYNENEVMMKFGARNALIPVVTQAIIGIAFMIDGSVIVETVFSWPGIGKLLVDSIFSRDLPTALAAFYILGVLIVILRLVTDVVYTIIDPRIAFGEN